MHNVLVTGVNGFIGSRIAEKLLSAGHSVTGIDIQDHSYSPLTRFDGYAYKRLDVSIPISERSDFDKVDVLIHCAALTHRKSQDLSRKRYFQVNHEGTINVLSALRRERLKQIFFLSSITVYGSHDPSVIPDEDFPCHPDGPYGESKLAAEKEIEAFGKTVGIPFTILRLVPVYGVEFLLNIRKRTLLPGGLLYYKIRRGHKRISLCSVHNVVAAIEYGMDRNRPLQGIFNLKDVDDYTYEYIIDSFKRFNRRDFRPVVRIPQAFPEALLRIVALMSPNTGRHLRIQADKILTDSLYAAEKIFSGGYRPHWDFAKTLAQIKP